MKGYANPLDVKAHADATPLERVDLLDHHGQIAKTEADIRYAHFQFADGKNFRIHHHEHVAHFSGYAFKAKSVE